MSFLSLISTVKQWTIYILRSTLTFYTSSPNLKSRIKIIKCGIFKSFWVILPVSSSIHVWTVSVGSVALMCLRVSSSKTSPVGLSDFSSTFQKRRNKRPWLIYFIQIKVIQYAIHILLVKSKEMQSSITYFLCPQKFKI